jgi:uncharacterized phage-associated protein
MFLFKFDKALHAAAHLLARENSKEMSYLRLLKILYLADRETVRHTGRPIVGGPVAAMRHGPVLSSMLDLINGKHSRSLDWAKFIHLDEYRVHLQRDPGQGSLSQFEIHTLDAIAEKFRSFDDWKLVDYTHQHCREWQWNKPSGTVKRKWIPLEALLKALGRSADINAVQAEDKAERAFEKLFGA